jgi:3-oxoadipate enol-lactonase
MVIINCLSCTTETRTGGPATKERDTTGKGREQMNTSEWEQQEVTAFDGIRLYVTATGPRASEAIIVANGYGMTTPVVAPIMRFLAHNHRVITWQPRVSPGPDGAPFKTECGPEAQVKDLERILDHYDVRRATAVLGWCSGASTALSFACRHAGRLHALALLNPFVPSVDDEPTAFGKYTRMIFSRVEGAPHLAPTFCRVLAQSGGLQPNARTAAPAGADVQALAMLVKEPFASPDALQRYAAAMNALLGAREALPHRLDLPLLLTTGLCDAIVNPRIAMTLHARYPGSRLNVDDTMDHYIPYRPSALWEAIAEFASAAKQART